jgi:hypothetical protein
VVFIGTLDEFFQWIIPKRYWGLNDVRLNGLAGSIFLLAIWKGIRPQTVTDQVKSSSVKILVAMITANLLFLGLCLSNTPGAVQRYSTMFKSLSWLQNEEPMSEFGFRHDDPEIGMFYSRFTLSEMDDMDRNHGVSYGGIIGHQRNQDIPYEELLKKYTPNTNPFLYEFLVHLSRRDKKIEEMDRAESINQKIEKGSIAFSEDLILEKHYSNTLNQSGLTLTGEKKAELRQAFARQQEPHISRAGSIIITSFTLRQVWTAIFLILIFVWIGGRLWKYN